MKYLLSFVIVFFSLLTFSQSTAKVVLYKGSVLKGEVIHYQFGDTLILKIDDQNTLSIPESYIKKLTFGGKMNRRNFIYESKKILNSSRFATDLGQTSGGVSISHTTYFEIKENLYIGAGIGVDNYYVREDFNVFPIYAAGRYYFYKKNISPFFDLRAGYALAFKNLDLGLSEANGGFHFNPSFGYRFGRKFHTEFTIGLKFQSLEYLYLWNEQSTSYDIKARRLNIGLNFTF